MDHLQIFLMADFFLNNIVNLFKYQCLFYDALPLRFFVKYFLCELEIDLRPLLSEVAASIFKSKYLLSAKFSNLWV